MKSGVRLIVIAAMLLATSACAGLGRMMTAAAGPPPTAAVLNSTSIDEASVDLIRDLFDVALYGVDALTDAGRIVPRSPQAVRVARLIRQISGFLGAADAAQRAGSSASYAEAIRNARTALREFQTAIGMPASVTAQLGAAPQVRNWSAWQTDASRLEIAARLDPTPSSNGASHVLR